MRARLVFSLRGIPSAVIIAVAGSLYSSTVVASVCLSVCLREIIAANCVSKHPELVSPVQFQLILP